MLIAETSNADCAIVTPLRRAILRIASAWQRAHKLWVILRTPSYWRALRHGVAASTEHTRSPKISVPRVVIDVGANRGQFAVVARHRFPEASLLCFEPLPKPRRQLRTVMDGDANLRTFPYALGEIPGTTRFHVAVHDDSSSLLATTSTQRQLFPGSAPAYEMDVEVRRLDDLIDPAALARPIFMKIDVQGTELSVLRGAAELCEVVDDLLVECSFLELYEGQPLAADVIDFLSGWSLYLSGIHNVVATPEGRCAQADLHFSRSASPPRSFPATMPS